MIEYYYKNKFEDKIEKIQNFTKGCWINIVNPTKDEIELAVKKFDISEANLYDGLDIHENSRFEIEGNKTYIYLNAPTNKIKHEYDFRLSNDEFIISWFCLMGFFLGSKK